MKTPTKPVRGTITPRRWPRITGLAAIGLSLAFVGCGDDDEPGPADGTNPPFNTRGTVTISGDTMVGSTLTAEVNDPNGATGSIAYQWAADADIDGATMSTYVLTRAEVDAAVTVRATYSDDEGFAESLTSSPTDVVTPRPNEAGSISISGVPSVGKTLTASVVDANGTTTSSPSYQWASDGTDIGGATSETYLLAAHDAGAQITVSATYTDDDGYDESITSDPVGPVSEAAVNVVGTVAIGGSRVVGETLTAIVDDDNGISGAIVHQWKAGDVDIAGATLGTYELTSDEKGKVIGVTVSYTDDDGFAEGPISATADDIVYTAIVTGEASLIAAASAATDGDIIGFGNPSGGDDYTNMAEVVFAANMLLVKRTTGSTAVIRGPTCLVFSGDGAIVDGLVLDDLDWRGGGTCDGNGDGSVYLSGTGITLRNSEFRGEALPRTVPSDDPYHYVALKGVDNLVERNLFQGKDMDNEGSGITMFADPTDVNNQGHTIQYNLFKDFLGKSGSSGSRSSTAHAIQVGRTTGTDSQGEGLFTIQYNRFDTVQSERRLMRVQSSANVIHGNTIVDSLGMIALEDGFGNTVSRNMILSGGEDSDDGGISFAPLGHTVIDNYINNLRTTSSQRAGLLINPDPLSGAGNTGLLGDGTLDFTVAVARNTVVNARQAVAFEDADCGDLSPILDFDNNLVMNQSSAESINGNTNGAGRTAVIDGDFDAICSIGATSDFDNNHFYSETLSESGNFDFNGALADNVFGAEDGATFTQDSAGLVNGSGPDAGIGVDTSILTLIEESQVGPGSSWTAP